MRLKGHNYGDAGFYFLTVTLEQGACLLGRVMDGQFQPSPAGTMVVREWQELSARFPAITWDLSCAMPNHFHSLIGLGIDALPEDNRLTVSAVMQAFKSITTVKYGEGVRQYGWPRYMGRLWHTGFHDHVVRSEAELERIREYIEANPSRWNEDRYYRA